MCEITTSKTSTRKSEFEKAVKVTTALAFANPEISEAFVTGVPKQLLKSLLV